MAFNAKRGIVIDASNNCALKCHKCERAWYLKNKIKPPGSNLTIDQFKKIIKYYNKFVEFTGQRGDVVLNPNLSEFLKITYEANIRTKICTAAGYRDKDWYVECFKANPNCTWVFGIDGLPHQSHIYRKNQKGEELFDIMVEGVKHLNSPPIWQYIAFNYNENNIEEAKELALKHGVNLELNISARWDKDDDPYKPKNEKYAKTPPR